MDDVLFWILMPYDALVVPPYFWVKVALGIATGFFIPNRIIGLLACGLGNAAIFAYAAFASGHSGSIANLTKNLTSNLTSPSMVLLTFLVMSLFAFIGLVWWVVGRIMRWAFYKMLARSLPAKSG
jgi:hypothetical protein